MNLVIGSILNHSAVQKRLFCEMSSSGSIETCLLPRPTPASAGCSSPVRRSTKPSTLTTPYTPPGHPKGSSLKSDQSVRKLSTYFGNSATLLIDDFSDPAPVDMKKYIQNISKISLEPQKKWKDTSLRMDESTFCMFINEQINRCDS